MQLSHLFRNSEFFIPFKAGDTVFKEGEPGDQMYVVLEGEVDIIVHERVVETVGVDNFLGEMALIDEGAPRSASVLAASYAELWEIDTDKFRSMVASNPNFALMIMRVMARRLRVMNQRYRPAGATL